MTRRRWRSLIILPVAVGMAGALGVLGGAAARSIVPPPPDLASMGLVVAPDLLPADVQECLRARSATPAAP